MPKLRHLSPIVAFALLSTGVAAQPAPGRPAPDPHPPEAAPSADAARSAERRQRLRAARERRRRQAPRPSATAAPTAPKTEVDVATEKDATKPGAPVQGGPEVSCGAAGKRHAELVAGSLPRSQKALAQRVASRCEREAWTSARAQCVLEASSRMDVIRCAVDR